MIGDVSFRILRIYYIIEVLKVINSEFILGLTAHEVSNVKRDATN